MLHDCASAGTPQHTQMKKTRHLQIFIGIGVMALLLSSCSNSSSPTAPTEVNLKTFPSRIVAIGDSITWGKGSSAEGEGYPALLEQKLQAEGYAGQVINEGVSGATTEDFLADWHWFLQSGDILLIMLGANDIQSEKLCVEPNNQQNCLMLKNIRAMTTSALNAGAFPVLATVTPTRTGDMLDFYNLAIQELNAQLKLIAAELKVPIVDTHTAILTNGGDALFVDAHHFNDLGYEVIASEFFAVLIKDPLMIEKFSD